MILFNKRQYIEQILVDVLDQNRGSKIHKALVKSKLRRKKNSMLLESTTTTGYSLPLIQVSPFHVRRVDVTTTTKFIFSKSKYESTSINYQFPLEPIKRNNIAQKQNKEHLLKFNLMQLQLNLIKIFLFHLFFNSIDTTNERGFGCHEYTLRF